MAADFPRLVFRCPGPHHLPHGKSYDHMAVDNQIALDKALAQGWEKTLPEALVLGGSSKPVEKKPVAPAAPSGPVVPVVKK